MSLFNTNYLSQSLVLAGSLSLYSGLAQAQTPPPSASGSAAPTVDIPQGRAGTATLCIEKRSYVDVNTKTIVTPVIYFDKIPDGGIDTGYIEGNKLAGEWKNLLNPTDPKKKEWMDESDIPTQFQDGVDVLKKLDKNKDGIVSKDEFETGEKGMTEADKKIDLGLLAALACSGKYLNEGALSTVDVNTFPEVIQLSSDLSAARTEIATLKETHAAELDAEHTKFKNYAIGAGVLGVLLVAGMGLAYSRGKKAAGGTPPAPKKTETPKTDKKTETKTATPAPAAQAAAPAPVATPPAETPAAPATTGYEDVLAVLNDKPSDDVLSAMAVDDVDADAQAQNAQPTAAEPTPAAEPAAAPTGKKSPPPLPPQL